MNPDWINALIGGLMIGTASGMLILGNGRIAGVSSILGELIARTKPTDWAERSLFIVGLLAAPLAYYATNTVPEVTVTNSLPLLIAGGLAVGFGARMGSGCTSGHGVCGNARLSKRSIVATLTFLTTGALTVAALNFLA
ncbi:MAG: YeeE/YedE family protein [Rhodobacteraceae bacterium]|nr:YeeE/YedE family protein [Paracoccaceae bacterium]